MGQRLFVAIDDSERRRRASPASIGGKENRRGRERALRDAGGYMGGGMFFLVGMRRLRETMENK